MANKALVKLIKVQRALKAPKNQYNQFGGYKYRSCEDILEAVKPLLDEATITLSDSLVQVGNRYYVKAEASFIDLETADTITVEAYAREEEKKKGMDQSQITGAASSYARKYALNGLLLIDDTKDADATNKHGEESKPKPVTNAQKKKLFAMMKEKGLSKEDAKGLYNFVLGDNPTSEQASDFINEFDGLYEQWKEAREAGVPGEDDGIPG